MLSGVVTIAVGLLVHFTGAGLNGGVRDITGDALWAMMIAWWVGALVPLARMGTRAAVAYALCVAVELSQLAHSPWLDSIRVTLLGQLVLGSGFDPRDLVSYAVGIACAVLLERRFLK